MGAHALESSIKIKSLATMLIMTSLIFIPSHLKHPGKIIEVLPLFVIKIPQLIHQTNPNFFHLENSIFVLKQKGKMSGNHNVIDQDH